MNLGIAAAGGSVIVRMDAHVEYPGRLHLRAGGPLERSGADNVGGVCQTLPAGDSAVAKAVAFGMSHPLGVGNSHFRIGTLEDRWVDTVPFGCYRREVFDRIGLFDEELVRNQDDEFNLRLIRHGGRILLSPRIVCKYFARDSLAKLWRMYYQYGYFKPLVVRKVGGVMTIRQLLPPLFVLSLIVTGLAAPWSWLGWPLSGRLPAATCQPSARLPFDRPDAKAGRRRPRCRRLSGLAHQLRSRLPAGSRGVPGPAPQSHGRCDVGSHNG